MVVRVSTMPLKSTICKHKGGIDQDIPITHKVIFKKCICISIFKVIINKYYVNFTGGLPHPKGMVAEEIPQVCRCSAHTQVIYILYNV